MTTRIERLIRDYMPGTKFTTSDEEKILLPGETMPEPPGEPSIPSPRDNNKEPRLMSVQPIGFQFPDFLSQGRSGATRAYKLFPNYQIFSPYDLERLDAYLFPIEQYVTPLLHEKLEKADRICNKVRTYSNAVMKKRYNYDVWSNLLGDIEIELSAFKKLPVGISIPIRTSLLDDMVASFVILNLIPKETKFFVQGFADACKRGGKNCWIGRLDDQYSKRYKYQQVSIYPYIGADPNNNYEVNGVNRPGNWESTPVIRNTAMNGWYNNLHLPELRARFFKEDVLDERMKYCIPNVQVDILQGWAYGYDDPNMRRVEIRVGVYSP
ncbi:hypothetical protein [Leptolyngbya sp. 7M]|uniref:hypothetical protein n=1 Tax=Leptolyngbya sp. 7M TaxID=2812896 RepID=UPI001B8CF658|nr:hypothetical protein [Leptolyngbya sp. 7M]QYO66682.1 hypothetical protein JVX88_07735 [Leptolyngbya sp. 7M]